MALTELARPRYQLARFEAPVSVEGAAVVVALRGEADLFTLPAIRAAVARANAHYRGPVIVDLAETSFLDIGTLRALGRAAEFVRSQGRSLTLRAPSPVALRLLALVGLSPLAETRDDAAWAAPGAPTDGFGPPRGDRSGAAGSEPS